MALAKCPRCELNYILDGGELCTVCRREVKGEPESLKMPEMCSVCGENPVIPGSDLCLFCLKEMNRHSGNTSNDDTLISPEDAAIGIDSVSTMDEIELDVVDDEMASEFDADGEFKDDEEDEEENSDEMISIDALADEEEAAADEDEDEE